ncbi:MAG TPA: SRPBCC domain-containing protein [Rhizomicrobium sp.]|jgi:uncharacterized protein YndB with AHSA1/START domain|nr:SRPBCC domain-containing protein [Rhizomicrobium sp.]
MAEAELARFIDRWTMEYVRVYPHPIARVWRAIVEPAEFGVWFIPGRLEPRVGGRYWFGDDGYQGTVQAIEPPRLLRLSDDQAGQVFHYELTEVAEGTQLQFIHRCPPAGPYTQIPDSAVDASAGKSFDLGGDLPGGPDTPWKPGFVAGYHAMFDELFAFLGGVPSETQLPPTELGTIAHWWAVFPPPSARDFTSEQRNRIARSLRLRERWHELIERYRAHIAATIPPAEDS